MKKNFDENFNILQKEICDITKNIDKVQKKNHQTMSKIVQKLKFINKETMPYEENTNNSSLIKINNTEYIQCKSAKNLKLNNYLSTYNNKNIYSKEVTDGNYKKHQPAIQIYKNYMNKLNELNNNTQANNCPNKTFNNSTDNSNSISIVKERIKFNKDKYNNLSKNMNMETAKNHLFIKDYFITEKINEKQIFNYNNKGINTLDLLAIPNNIKIKITKPKANNKFNNREKISFNKNIKYNLDLGYHWNKEAENDKDTNQEKNKFEYNMFSSRLGHKSTNNIYKTKINSFNKQSNNYYKKITLKEHPSLNIYKNGIYEKNKVSRINNCSEKIKRNLSYKKKSNNNYNDNKKKRSSNNFNSLDVEKLRKIDINKSKNFNKLEQYDMKSISKIKKILNCKNYEECLKKINKLSEQKSFIKKIFSLYQKCGGSEQTGDNYQNCLIWINNLIRKERQLKNNNKYEDFCKKIMKENNIKNFSVFQLFVQNAFNEKKNENNFLEDIKRILSVEDCILTERNKDINKNLIERDILEENKENIINNNLNQF